MHNVLAIFLGDLKRATSNTVTRIIIVGLIVLPSIFAWYNCLACWDAFSNTGNLKVALANSDEGYKSSLVPLKLNIGDQVVSKLRADESLSWVVTSEEDAVDGARSGRYYAAVVIPASFSQDMMTFYTSDSEHAPIMYYTNQKKNAVAPMITSQDADKVSYNINRAFSEVLAEVGANLCQALLETVETADSNGTIAEISAHLSTGAAQLTQAANVMESYTAVASGTKQLLEESEQLIRETKAELDKAAPASEEAAKAAGEAKNALERAIAELDERLGSGEDAGSSTNAGSDAEAGESSTEELISQAESGLSTDLSEAREQYQSVVRPQLAELAASLEEIEEGLRESTAKLDSLCDTLIEGSDTLCAKIDDAIQGLGSSAQSLRQKASKLESLSAQIDSALTSGDFDTIKSIFAEDPAQLAESLTAPVEVTRTAVFPVENFGSALSPLYTSLALWIGALLAVVAVKALPGQSIRAGLRRPRLWQEFLGRWGIFALIALLQALLMATGNLVFLGIQAAHPALYLLCFAVGGLVDSFIMYTLVASMGNVGKAIGVLLLIMQVTGGGGSFPLQLLPQFIQDLSQWLPATHIVNAMRAAMMGVYENDFWIEICKLLLFVPPFAVLGLALRKPLMRLNARFVKKAEATKLI